MNEPLPPPEQGLARPPGGRPAPAAPARLVAALALLWSLTQVWMAAPWSWRSGNGALDDGGLRVLHLGFALLLAFLAGSAERPPRGRPSRAGLVPGLLAVACLAGGLAWRPAPQDAPGLLALCGAGLGMVLLLEATRRILGAPLAVLALLLLAYEWADASLVAAGHGFVELVRHQWFSTDGVFGTALGVSARLVFLFVLFGALLERAGAGAYFLRLAFALCGRRRGGSAQAAVLAAGLNGLVSGASATTVATSGARSLALMRRAGLTRETAGGVLTAAAVGGQLMPPVMGTAAFLMVEYLGLPYADILRHAVLPALLAYLALLYAVHLDAAGPAGHAAPVGSSGGWWRPLAGPVLGIAGLAGLSLLTWHGLGWLYAALGEQALPGFGVLSLLAYLAALVTAARHRPSPPDGHETVARARTVLLSGLHHWLPLGVLIGCLTVARLPPAQAAFWGVLCAAVILLTQRPLLGWLTGNAHGRAAFREGMADLGAGLSAGARHMVGIAIATATAGMIVGAVAQTGAGALLTGLLDGLSGGHLFVVLPLVALCCLLLGAGLPTTANYIVVSSLLVPAIAELGQRGGLSLPVIAVHLFVFYFGALAAAMPPGGRAVQAAADLAGGDPLATGRIAIRLGLCVAVLPFLFLFDGNLLLLEGLHARSLLDALVTAFALLLLVAAAGEAWLTRSRWYERLALVLVAFTLVRPGIWLDGLATTYREVPSARLTDVLGAAREGERLRVQLHGVDAFGAAQVLDLRLPVLAGGGGAERLERLGLQVRETDGRTRIEAVAPGSPADAAGLMEGQTVLAVHAPRPRLAPEWFWLPALALLGLVAWRQRRRAG